MELYGNNWQQLANRGNDHITIDNRNSSGMPFFLNNNDYEPALFVCLLMDNLTRIKELIVALQTNCRETPAFNQLLRFSN